MDLRQLRAGLEMKTSRPRGPLEGPRGPLKGPRVPLEGRRGPSCLHFCSHDHPAEIQQQHHQLEIKHQHHQPEIQQQHHKPVSQHQHHQPEIQHKGQHPAEIQQQHRQPTIMPYHPAEIHEQQLATGSELDGLPVPPTPVAGYYLDGWVWRQSRRTPSSELPHWDS